MQDNKNINQGQGNEKKLDRKTAMDGSGTSDSSGNQSADERARKAAAGKKSGDQQTESQNLQGTEQSKDDDNYDVNEQFDLDEDYGSSTRQ